MNFLPREIHLIIIQHLPIPDVRKIIRCNRLFNSFKDKIQQYQDEFIEMINDTKYLGEKIITLNNFEKYTLECAYYGYANMILPNYIRPDNKILYNYPRLYFNSAKRKFKKLIKILFHCNKSCKINICSGAAFGGHLNLLKWARENGCDWDSLTCTAAACNGHMDILKWARENGCDWNSDACAYAALNGHLEVLKWAREHGLLQ